jgi:hypothetical protein
MGKCAFCGGETKGRRRVCSSLECIEQMKQSWHESSIAIPEGYLTATEFAKKHGLTTQAVSKRCRAGKYPGVFQDPQSGRWYIPEDAKLIGKDTVGTKIKHNPPGISRRKKRPLKATDKEWEQIVNLATQTKYSVNEYILRKALGKDV